MVIDTSVLVAILLREPDARKFLRLLYRASSRQLSAVSYVETSMVLMGRFDRATESIINEMLQKARITVTAVSVEHAKFATEAFRRFGKGRHPAGLNFGDCFSYALAKESSEPLLFKGTDFSKTDIIVAV